VKYAESDGILRLSRAVEVFDFAGLPGNEAQKLAN
jgi:hypothetical protein